MFEQVSVESALDAIYKSIFLQNGQVLTLMNVNEDSHHIMMALFEKISNNKEFMDDVLEDSYLVLTEDDLLWVDDVMPELKDLSKLDSDDFFNGVIDYIKGINVKLKEIFLDQKDAKYLDLIDINLMVMDALTFNKADTYGVNGSLVKEVYNEYKGSGNKELS